MLQVGIHAVTRLSSGGLTVLLGYLRAWRSTGAALAPIVFASEPRVIDAVRRADCGARVVPCAVGLPLARRLVVLHRRLGAEFEREGCGVVWSPNQLVERCRLPQVVHHQNLLLVEGPAWRAAGRGPKRLLQVLAARRALRRAAANVFISEWMREVAEREIPESHGRNHAIPNGLDEAVLAGGHAGAPWEPGADLLAVTSEERHKDNPLLIRALARLVASRPDRPWRLMVAGPGRYGAERRLARRLGVASRVDWLGLLDATELDRRYRRALCLLHPSRREGFGLPVIEAMARGCPVIAARAGAVPEVVGEAGLLVESGRPELFVRGVLDLEGRPGLRGDLVRRGLERARAYRWSASAGRLFEVLSAAASASS